MSTQHTITLDKFCRFYEVELAFINGLIDHDLVQVITIKQTHYIHYDNISHLERIIRLHRELNINIEGIDVIFNLLDKISEQQEEIMRLRSLTHRSRMDLFV